MSDLPIDATHLQLMPVSVTRKMASALPGLRKVALEKGLKIHHLGAGYPHPEVTNPKSFIESTETWFEHLAAREGLNDPNVVPHFLADAYAYTDTLGPRGPRESFAHVYSKDWGVNIDPDRLLPTGGATGGINLLCSAFERAGEPVAYLTDAPTYAGFLTRATLNQRAAIYSMSMDTEGPNPDEFRSQLKQARADGFYVPFYYTVPDGHNPAGFSFSTARRLELLEIVREEGILIVEDAPYLYISYVDEAKRPKPFIALDPKQTVHLFTGSKIGLPGPRVGFLYTEAELVLGQGSRVRLADLLLTESSADILFHNPLAFLSFESLLHFADGSLRDSLWPIAGEKLKIYKENRELLLDGLQEGLGMYPSELAWTTPAAGFFSAFKINVPGIRVDDAFIQRLVENHGVVVVPMYAFYPDDALSRDPFAGMNEIRLSFCFTESQGRQRIEDLRSATQAFCTAIREECSLR